MKWLMAHYHACCALARVRSLESQFEKFRSRAFYRLRNFNVCLDSTVSHLQKTRQIVDHSFEQIDLLSAGERHLSRDMVDLSEQIVLVHQRIDKLNRCIELQNGMIADLNRRLEDVSLFVVRPSALSALPSVN